MMLRRRGAPASTGTGPLMTNSGMRRPNDIGTLTRMTKGRAGSRNAPPAQEDDDDGEDECVMSWVCPPGFRICRDSTEVVEIALGQRTALGLEEGDRLA